MAIQPNNLINQIDQAQLGNYQAQMDSLALNMREIRKKVEAGEEITTGELNLVKQFKYAEIASKALQNQDITDQELAFVKEYKPSIMEEPVKEITSTGGSKESKVFANLRNKPEAVKEALNSMRSVLDSPLPNGGTVRERFLSKVYGKLYITGKDFGIKKDGEIVPAPKEDIVGGLGSFGGKLATGVTGEIIGAGLGAPLGPVGALAGGAIGAGVGEGVVGVTDRVNDSLKAREFGLVEDQEIPEFAFNVLGEAAKESAVVVGLTGALSTLKPIASKIAKELRVSGTTGREIGVLKGKVEQQALSDQLLEDIAPINEMEKATPGLDVFGETAKKIALNIKNNIINTSNKLFDKADAEFANKLQTGNFGFIDASDLYNKFANQLQRFQRQGVLAAEEAADMLNTVQNQLNGVKKDVLDGFIPASEQAIQKFQKASVEFDPKVVTGADYRRTTNAIDELFSRISSKRGKKALSQLSTDIQNKVGASGESSLYKQAFKEKGKLYKSLPEDLIGVDESTLGSDVGDIVTSLNPEEAAKFRGVVALSPEKEIFEKSAKKRFMETTAILKKGQREVRKSVEKGALKQAAAREPLEARTLEEAGTKLELNPIKKALLESGEKSSQLEPMVSGKGLSDRFFQQKGKAIKTLLGESGEELEKTANRLESAQSDAGIVTRLQDSSKFKGIDVLDGAKGIGEEILTSVPGGKAASKVLSMTVNPLQRGAASLIDTAPLRPAPFGGFLGEQTGVLPTDEPTEEQKRRIRLGVSKTRLLD